MKRRLNFLHFLSLIDLLRILGSDSQTRYVDIFSESTCIMQLDALKYYININTY